MPAGILCEVVGGALIASSAARRGDASASLRVMQKAIPKPQGVRQAVHTPIDKQYLELTVWSARRGCVVEERPHGGRCPLGLRPVARTRTGPAGA